MSESSELNKLEQVTQIGAKVLWRPTREEVQKGIQDKWYRGTVRELSKNRDIKESLVGIQDSETRELKLRLAREIVKDFHHGDCSAPASGCLCEDLRDY